MEQIPTDKRARKLRTIDKDQLELAFAGQLDQATDGLVTAEAGGAQALIANRTVIDGWEMFEFGPALI